MPRALFATPLFSFFRAVIAACGRVGVARSAAALAYFLILSLFPLLLCVHALIGRFHLDLTQLLSSLAHLLPAGVTAILEDYVGYVAASSSPALFWAGLFTIAVSASAGLRTLFRTMDDLYALPHRRGPWHILSSVALSLLLLLTVYLSVVVVVTGDWFFGLLQAHLPPTLTQQLPLPALAGLWGWLRYLLLFCFVLLLVLMVYRAGIPSGAMEGRALLLSALCAALALAACSSLFSWFIGLSSRYALVYGSLASLVILLVWLYLCGSILLLGPVIAQVLAPHGTKPPG